MILYSWSISQKGFFSSRSFFEGGGHSKYKKKIICEGDKLNALFTYIKKRINLSSYIYRCTIIFLELRFTGDIMSMKAKMFSYYEVMKIDLLVFLWA